MDLKSGFRSLLGGRVLVMIIGTVSLPVVVRVLGPGGYGDYAFLLSTFSMLMILVSPAVTEGVQKFVAEDREDDCWKEHVVGFYLRLAVALAAFGSIALALATWTGVVGRIFGVRYTFFFHLLAVYVVCAQLRSFTRHSLLGLELEKFSESLSVLDKLTALAIGLGLAMFGFGVAGFLVGHIAAAALFTVGGFLVLRWELSISEMLRVRLEEVPVGALVSFNVFNVVLVVLMQSLFHTDVLMIQFFEGSQQTGYYKSALVLAEYIWLVPIVLQRLLLHSASQLWSDGRRDRIQSLAARLTRYVFLVTSLLGIGIFVLADRFVPLYFGTDYAGAVRPLVFLLPGAFGFALARPLYGINQATGRLKPLVIALSVSSASNVGLNVLLIPEYGITGAAVATSVSYGSMFVLQVACARYLGYAPLRGIRSLRLVATVALAGPAIVVLEHLLDGDLVALAIVPPLGFLVFSGSAILTGAIDTTEIRDAMGVLPSPIEKRLRVLTFEND